MPDARAILAVPADPGLARGVRAMVRDCLRLGPADRFVLVADEATKRIAAGVLREVQAVGTPTEAFLLEVRGGRPMKALPREIAFGLERATASLLACAPLPGEIGARIELVEIARSKKLRHAHAPGITERMVQEGLCASPDVLGTRNARILERLGRAREIVFRSKEGTDLRMQVDRTMPWDSNAGVIRPGLFANLPAGQITVLPGPTQGVYVADGSLSEWFGPRYGVLRGKPITFTIEGSVVKDVACPDAAVAREVRSYLRGDPEGGRVGEIGLGTNPMVPDLIGLSLQDELCATVHVAFGRPHPLAPVRWTARTHLSAIASAADVIADGETILSGRKYASWVDG
jgi:hypothetical protein